MDLIASLKSADSTSKWLNYFGLDQFNSIKELHLLERVRSIYLRNSGVHPSSVNLRVSSEDSYLQLKKDESSMEYSHLHLNKRFLNKDKSLSMDVHPLMLIESKDLPTSLMEKLQSQEMSEEVFEELQVWVEQYFGIEIKDKKEFQDAVIFYSGIWKQPEMIERVQNLLVAKHILEAKTYQAAWKWTGAINPLPLILVAPVGFLFGLAISIIAVIAIFAITAHVILCNRSNSRGFLDFIRRTKDVEALKIVLEASEAVQRTNEGFFSKCIPSFLSLNPSLKDLLAKMEAFAKEKNVVYEPLPKTGFENENKINNINKNLFFYFLRPINFIFWTTMFLEGLIVASDPRGFGWGGPYSRVPLFLGVFNLAICKVLNSVNRYFKADIDQISLEHEKLKEIEELLTKSYQKAGGVLTYKDGKRQGFYYKGLYIRSESPLDPTALNGYFDVPTKYVAAAFAILLLFNTNVLQSTRAYLSSFWNTISKPSQTIVDPPPQMKFTPKEATSPTAKAVNACVSRFLHAPSLNAGHIFQCLDPSKPLGYYDNSQKIKQAYRALTQFLHPDHGGSSQEMYALSEAKEKLNKIITSKAKAVNDCVSRFLDMPCAYARYIFQCLDPSKPLGYYDNSQKIEQAYSALTQFLYPGHGGSSQKMVALDDAKVCLTDFVNF